jgi:hypothetical protein
MKLPFRSLVALVALVVTAVAHAETTSARIGSTRPVSPILAALDSDRDGTLSNVEIAAAPVMLRALDRNDDGLISPDELRAADANDRTSRPQRSAMAFNVVMTLDANHDGDIQWLEIANAVSSLKRLDRNGDGELTPEELRPVLVARG